MDKELKYLIDMLKEAQLDREAEELTQLLIKSAQIIDTDLEAWQNVLNELDKPHDIQVQGKMIHWFVESAKNLMAAEDLKDTEPEDIIDAAKTMKKVMAKQNLTPDQFFIKNAGPWGMLGKAAPLFSFIIALKNLYYGFQEFKKIQSEAPVLGLNWMDTMQPSKMMTKAQSLDESPEELIVLVKLTKSAMLLWDEGISLVINLLDGFKDILMLLPQIIGYFGTMGIGGITLTGIDFGISMALWLLVEAPAEKHVKGLYVPELEFIRSTAETAVLSLISQQAPPIDDSQDLPLDSEEEEFDPEAWWASVSRHA